MPGLASKALVGTTDICQGSNPALLPFPERQGQAHDDPMGQRGVHTGELGDADAVDRQLEVIEFALNAGDLGAAREHLRAFRRTIRRAHHSDQHLPVTLLGGAMLTCKETATLRLLPDGSLSQKDIARTMGVTRNTLKTHLKSLYLKLGVHCRSEAIHRAREVGSLPRPLSFGTLSMGDLVDVA